MKVISSYVRSVTTRLTILCCTLMRLLAERTIELAEHPIQGDIIMERTTVIFSCSREQIKLISGIERKVIVMIVSYSRFDLKFGFDQFFPLLLAFFLSSFPLFSLVVSVFLSALASFPFSFFSGFSLDLEASFSFLVSFFSATLLVFPLDFSAFFIDFSRSLMAWISLSFKLYFSFHSSKSFLQFSSQSLQVQSIFPFTASDNPSHSFLTLSARSSSFLYS